MSRSRTKNKTLIITDDDDDEEEQKDEEQNPFSFKEFLRSKNLDQSLDQDLDQSPDQSSDQSLDCEEPTEAAREWRWAPGGGVRLGACVSEQEEEVTRFDSSLQHNDDDEEDEDESRQSYEGDDEASVLDPESRTRTRIITGLQQVQEENQQLKKIIRKLRQDAVKNQSREAELRAELLQRQQRDQQEALDLETMVQSVENNLRVMTKRALKAEATVSKLRTEVKQLQVRVQQVEAENQDLRASESEVVLTMKQNAQTASERLQETASHAQDSVRRLLSEAESLRFVSELLRSIDRMSSVP